MKVPFLDLNSGLRELRHELDEAIGNVLDSGWFVLGPELEAFEAEFAEYTGTLHTIGVASGLDALRLSLMALGIGPGDEVLVPSNTFIATWLAVTDVGATPVPVEPDPTTHNLDATRMRDALTSRTRAIIPVHLYGLPADLQPILEFAAVNQLQVVEDAAQAHGAEYADRRVGGFGITGCWSFYPGKNLGALGDGGAITTNDGTLAAKLRMLRNYGSEKKYIHSVLGINSRLDEIQAALLRVKLRHLDDWNKRRRRVVESYESGLGSSGLQLPLEPPGRRSSWHLYVVQSDERDVLAARLRDFGVETLVHYPLPAYRQAAYSGFDATSLPIAEALSRRVLSLPMGPHLSEGQVTHVIDAVDRAARLT